jgi:two-component system, sensor histidine kinase and response regulator
MANADGEVRLILDAALCEVLELVPDAIIITDQQGRIVHLNAIAERLSMRRRQELVGQSLEMLVPERYRGQHERLRREYSREPEMRGMGGGGSFTLLRGDGEEIPVDISLRPWSSPHGPLILAAVRDVTLHNRREEALRASEERFALAVRGSTDGIWDWNVLSNEVFYSPRFKELLGCEDHEMENVFASFESRLPPEDLERVHAALRAHFERRVPYDIEYRLRTKSGEYRWFRARGQAVWDLAGRATRMAGSISDITEQKRSQQRFELAVHASPVGLLIVDRSGTIRLVNARLEHEFGYRSEELVGKSVELLVPERLRAEQRDLLESFIRNPDSQKIGGRRELYARRRNGGEFPVEIGLSLLETDEELLVLCGIANVTDRREAMVAMQTAKEAAEAANRAKSDFLANMSHEIRTPLNAVIGMTELVLDTELTPPQREYLTMVTEAGDLLLSIINEILDFSKIEAGHVELERAEFHLRDVLGDSMRTLAPRAHSRKLELAYEVAPGVPDRLLGDATRFRQLLLNLVGNAIKFTEYGEVVVRIDCPPPTSHSVLLRCDVSDTGIGIATEKQSLIFEAFAQSDTSTTRNYGGTGLGLTICRRLVDLMGGAIWVESELGRGSTFSFTVRFDLAPAQDAKTPLLDADALRSLPVLIVDDNATNRKILHEMLRHWEMDPTSVTCAAEAVDLLRIRQASGTPFRLVLTDVNMPGVDGFMLCEQIRSIPELADLVVVVLTSGDRVGDIALCEQLAIAARLLKPVKPSELINVVLRALGKAVAQEGRDAGPSVTSVPSSTTSLRVLLAEDSTMNQKLVVGLLNKWGHSVQVATHGLAAIRAWERDVFDVILMDVQMPEMNGLEATAAIRQREAQTGGHIPIIALTAHALRGDREQCLAAGMDGYVSKPIRHSELFHTLQACVPALGADHAGTRDESPE